MTPRPASRPLDRFLETNGLGGFACTTLCGVRPWPSFGLVVVSKRPPGHRYVLLNGFDVTIETDDGDSIPLVSHRKRQGVLEPDANERLLGADAKPWPACRYDLGEQRQLQFEFLARHGADRFVFGWQLTVSDVPMTLIVRPLLSGRPLDSTRSASSTRSQTPRIPGRRQFVWSLPAGSPPLSLFCDGAYREDPVWFRDFSYLDGRTEDLLSPCEFRWFLHPRDRAHIIASTEEDKLPDPHTYDHIASVADKLRNAERTRRHLFRTDLDRAADQYIVAGRNERTILSGYPLGGERGAAAMIALRAVCLSPGRLEVAGEILATWQRRLAGGLLPSEISDNHRETSFRASAESSLWFIVAVYEYLRAADRQERILPPGERPGLFESVSRILTALLSGRHPGAFVDEDGLLAERHDLAHPPEEGVVAKRAHLQALWMNALKIGERLQGDWSLPYQQARSEFPRLFWNPERGHLDARLMRKRGQPLARIRELDLDQVLAVGGLPIVTLPEDKASLLIHALEQRFEIPGKPVAGASLPWQFGPFVEGWYRIHHRLPDVHERVLERFLRPWQAQLETGSLNHLEEDMDFGDAEPAPGATQHAAFACAETLELLRLLHLPDLRTSADPFDDALLEPLSDGPLPA